VCASTQECTGLQLEVSMRVNVKREASKDACISLQLEMCLRVNVKRERDRGTRWGQDFWWGLLDSVTCEHYGTSRIIY
jgi:hypothetical protein